MLHQALHLDRVKTQASRYSFHALRRQDRGAFAHEQHTECREIVRQHAPFAVQNLPARSDDWQVAHPVAFSLFDVKTMLPDLYPPVSDQQPEEGQSHGVLEESDLPARKAFMFRKSDFHLHQATGAGNTFRPSEPTWTLSSVASHTATPFPATYVSIRSARYHRECCNSK